MPHYTTTDLQYAPLGEFKVWVDARNSFSASSLAKLSDPSSERQAQFERELLRLSHHLKSAIVPIFVNWPNVGRRRMDKGCVGHAVASGFLSATDGAGGYVEYVEILGSEQ